MTPGTYSRRANAFLVLRSVLAADKQASLIEEAMAQALPGAAKVGEFAEVSSLDAARALKS